MRYRVTWTDEAGALHMEGYKTREDAEWRRTQLSEQGITATVTGVRG
jgi:cell division protein FtsN